MSKALIAMSGGVDSSVAAYLVQSSGVACIGATMQLHPSPQQYDDAAAVADRLRMPFHVLDFQKEFRQYVMDAFVEDYENGLTPNPCVVCNQKLKFGYLMEAATELGCDYVVTGHYARVAQVAATGRWVLKKLWTQAKTSPTSSMA